MQVRIQELAYAKINLTLDITGRREDGYHTIDSIMQTVTLTDMITLTYDSEKNGISLSCNLSSLVGEDNLCCKAADAFLKAAKLNGGVTITLTKKIPIAAGLGGGSADAAAVLRALTRIFPNKLTTDTLLALAAKLGADVPFCLVGGCMRARGIGDLMEVLPQIPAPFIVIARQGSGISATDAYKFYDANPTSKFHTERAVQALQNNDANTFFSSVSNGFEAAIFPIRSEAERLCRELCELGALTAHMSGSGSAVFGIYQHKAIAQNAAHFLRESGAFAEICQPCSVESAQN